MRVSDRMPSSIEPAPELHVTGASVSTVRADLIVVPVLEEDAGDADLAAQSKTLAATLEVARRSGEFSGRAFDMLVERVADWATPRVLLVGCGKQADLSVERVRRVASAAGLAAKKHRAPHVAFVLGGATPAGMA